uniref:Fibrinogen-like protein 1-like n=1 Tax=Saccoglossus kowalevskii TaxID=10224 RepID=A0ABM0M195_SACKO
TTRTWAEYKEGFGNTEGEYWIGNNIIHHLTNQATYKLRIDLKKWSGITSYTDYDVFMIENEDNNYKLHLGKSTGLAGDSLNNNEQLFSTIDRDNNNYCARDHLGGWWYDDNDCRQANLNGFYSDPMASRNWALITWYTFNLESPLKGVTMKIQKNI